MEESKDSTMFAIPTVRLLRSASGADDEVVEEDEALLGWDTLQNRGTMLRIIRVCTVTASLNKEKGSETATYDKCQKTDF